MPNNIQTGLTSAEAKKRLAEFGPNVISRKKKIRPIAAFFKKLNSPLLLILIAVAIISFFLNEKANALIIIAMVMISALLEFENTYRSEKAVEKLLEKVRTNCKVVRGGQELEIDLRQVVPDDILILEAGNIIPADCRVLSAKELYVNQSALTGESFPAEKRFLPECAAPDANIERIDLLFLGTSVVSGYATAKVLKTGNKTEFGKIAERLSVNEPETEFEKSMKKFSFFVMRIILVLVSVVFLVNSLMGHGVLSSFLFAIAVAIGLTPELLPVIMSVSLSRGSVKMAKKNVIVKNLPSIENFGQMDTLFTDKTGTLTENKIALVEHIDFLGQESEEVFLYAYLSSLYHSGIKNPLDEAIKNHKKISLANARKIEEMPFDFERKRSSVAVMLENKRLLITKGAPEKILEICTHYKKSKRTLALDNEAKKNIAKKYDELSEAGFRVLAIAVKEMEKKETYSKNDENGLIFAGFAAFLDPPKDTSDEAIKEINDLGIEIKVLTGDSELLTKKICGDIGLKVKGIISGAEIAKLNNEELKKIISETTIFARVNPEQKEKIILLAKEIGCITGYLGDGINDAPSLRAADVGISVNNAVDVAKETADIILLEKSLEVLRDGVIEGRKTFNNTMKYIMMCLSSNFGNMFSMIGASVMLPFLPMLPSQILLNNFLYDVSQLTISSDKVDGDDIKFPPKWDIKFIKKYMLVFGLVSSIFDFVTFWLLYYVFHFSEAQFQTGWFIESIATQVLVIYIIRTKKLPFFQSSPSALLFFNALTSVIIAWVIPFTFMGVLFKFEALPVQAALFIAGVVMLYLLIVELVKRMFYKWQFRQIKQIA